LFNSFLKFEFEKNWKRRNLKFMSPHGTFHTQYTFRLIMREMTALFGEFHEQIWRWFGILGVLVHFTEKSFNGKWHSVRKIRWNDYSEKWTRTSDWSWEHLMFYSYIWGHWTNLHTHNFKNYNLRDFFPFSKK
jgi:hypothetical protein